LKSNYKFVLASTSPRRKELLKEVLGTIPFKIIAPTIDEETLKEWKLAEIFERLERKLVDGKISVEEALQARKKYLNSAFLLTTSLAEAKVNTIEKVKDTVYISCDTVVYLNDTILEKPNSREEAFRMLSLLSDNTHHVMSAVSIYINGRHISFYDKTAIKVSKLTDNDISSYLDSMTIDGELILKGMSGSYAIQSSFINFVLSIEGSKNNVMGLPTESIKEKLLFYKLLEE